MMLYLMRHGLAGNPNPEGDDSARKLTPRGRDRIREAAAGMRAMKLRFDVILTSPFARAADTASIVAAEMGEPPAPEPMPELAAGTAPAEMLNALKHLPPHQRILIVGHEPGLSRLASLLLSGSAEAANFLLKKGGLIAFEFPDRIESGAAVLRWMLTQKQLRRLRG